MVINYRPVIKALGIEEGAFTRAVSEADSILKYTESKISGRNFWQVSPDELRFIYSISVNLKARNVVETGVGPGTTSYAFLTALKQTGGKLTSFDLGVKYGDAEKGEPVGFVVPEDLKHNWRLITGDSKKTLPSEIVGLGPIDIFMHDSEHTYEHVTFELNTVSRHLSSKFLILVDNYDWTQAPVDFSKEKNLKLTPIADDLCAIYA